VISMPAFGVVIAAPIVVIEAAPLLAFSIGMQNNENAVRIFFLLWRNLYTARAQENLRAPPPREGGGG
jgi:hypothetical protein